MLWIIQRNLYNEDGYQRFTTALERLELPFQVVKPVPFYDRIVAADFDSFASSLKEAPEVEIDDQQKIMVMGANTLTKVALARGWQPGTFFNDNFNHRRWCEGFGSENLLNGEARLLTPRAPPALVSLPAKLFARPVEDNKAFAGQVMDREDFLQLLANARQVDADGPGALHADTAILVAPVKTIHAEYRLFVVGGRIVTGSLYKQGLRVCHSDFLPREVQAFGEAVIARWQPAAGFVLDVAETDEGCRIVELNNLNGAGFYAADAFKIIVAIEDFFA